jgi:heat shock protein HslJ
MTDDILTDLLERSAERIAVGPAPLAAIERGARRRGRRTTTLAAVAAFAVAAAATGGVMMTRHHTPTPGPAHQVVKHPHQQTLGPDAVQLDGTWVVRALVDQGGRSVLPVKDQGLLRLRFHDGRVTGSTTCNTVSGRYVQSGAKGQDLRFPPNSLGTTLVGCQDEPPLSQELLQVRHVSVAGGQVYLHAANWMIVIALSRLDPH